MSRRAIISAPDGVSNRMRIVDPETGADIVESLPIRRAVIDMDYGHPVRATLEVVTIRVDRVEAIASWIVPGIGGGKEIAEIRFADGSVWTPAQA